MRNALVLRNLILFFGAVIVLFGGIVLLTGARAVPVETPEALAGVDFTSQVARVADACFAWYPNALLTPEDFAAGNAPAPLDDAQGARYGTYRLTLPLPPGIVYGMTAYSATYAQTVWVGGELLSAVGTPGDSLETMVPKTNHYAVYFTPVSNETEIVIQRSGFVHAAGGQLYAQYIGPQEKITALRANILFTGSMAIGCMLMASLFFFGIYLFFQNRLHFLWFSLACLLVAVRSLCTDHKLIMVVFPNLAWTVAYKTEHLAMNGFLLCFSLYVDSMFERLLPRPLLRFGFAMSATYALLVALLPPYIFTHVLNVVHVLTALLAVAAVTLLAFRVGKTHASRAEQRLVLLGTAGLTACMLLDLVRYLRLDDLNLTQLGMLIFVFANALALTLRFTRTEAELARARDAEREMAETNRLLERLNRLKTDFLANISHEMRTPLTVMSGFAQLVSWQVEEGATGEKTQKHLSAISSEAQRLAALVGGLLSTSIDEHDIMGLRAVQPEEILTRAAAVIEPILQKNANNLLIEVEQDCPPARANDDMLLQVLMNLCANANRHMKGGALTIAVRHERDHVVFEVADSGDGIDPALVGRVFERGASGDGGTGLGLAISREVIEAQGGAIWIESVPGEGTCVTFTLPVER